MDLYILTTALLWHSLSVHLSFAAIHKLQYIHTAVTAGINFPEYTDVGLVDGEPFVYYDSNIRKYTPKTEWIKKITDSDADYWNSETQDQHDAEEIYREDITTLMQRFNQTEGVHTLQRLYGCEINDDGTVRGYDQVGFNGEDFISLDLESVTWTPAKPQADLTKHKLDATGTADADKYYLENICIEWLQKYVSYGREILERKVRPEVSVFQKHSSPEVVCHATGFFPESVTITWQKDGEDVIEDVEFSETLPNNDGSFQKRSVLKVPAEALQKHTYTCVVQHSSLEEEMVMPVSNSQILRDGLCGDLTGGRVYGVFGIVFGAAVVLVAVAVILIWRVKKKSDFKLVTPNVVHSSEEKHKTFLN